MLNGLLKNLNEGKAETWILLVLFCVIIIYFFLKIIKKINLKNLKSIDTPFLKAEFDTDNNESEKVKEEKVNGRKSSPHSKCVHAKDVVKVLQQQRINIRKADKAEMMYIPRDLMNLAEDELDNIIAKLETIFLVLLKEKRGNKKNLVSDHSYHAYQTALALAKRDILKEVLRMIRENNFHEKEEKGTFETYKKTKAKNIYNTLSDSLNRYYIEDDPSREETYDRNIKIIKDSREDFDLIGRIEMLIEGMKEQSKAYTLKINKYEREIDEMIEGLFEK